MDNVEPQPHDTTGPQGKGAQEPSPQAPRGMEGFAPAHESAGATPPGAPPPPENENSGEQPAAKRSGRRRRLAGILLLLMILGGLILGFLPRWRQHNTAVADMNQLAIPTVSVVSPAPGAAGTGLILPAEVRPWREASIYARANGYLKEWVANIGAHVQAGQLLAEIETPELNQQLEQGKAQLVLAQANLHLAETTDARWQELLKAQLVSEQDAAVKTAARETAAASVAAARADMRRLQELVSFQRVVAPFTGTITIRAVDVGDLIVAGNGGRELFHIAQSDKLRVYIRVPEPHAIGIAAGQTATLSTPASPGRVFPAKVTTTSEAISSTSRTLLTELEVDNSQRHILPYSYGEVHLTESHSAPPLVLPSNTLMFRAQGLQVGVVRADSTVELRSVQVGRDIGQTVEILSGVTPADRVIINPTDSLINGAKVRVDSAPNVVTAK